MSRPSDPAQPDPRIGRFAAWGAMNGALAVLTGAFGAHGLRERVTPELLAVWNTGAHYHLVHAVALIAGAWVLARWPGGRAAAGCWLLLTGMLIFAGSLYVLVLSGVRTWGAVTPVGGTLMIAGWVALAAAPLSRKTHKLS